MSKAYIVTEGEYSDYAIKAVFSTREKAQEWIDSWGPQPRYGGKDIEECEMDAAPKARPVVRVEMQPDGKALATDHLLSDDPTGFQGFWYAERLLVWDVETDDDTRAIKVVNEKRAQIIAQNLWNKDEECKGLFGVIG